VGERPQRESFRDAAGRGGDIEGEAGEGGEGVCPPVHVEVPRLMQLRLPQVEAGA
jgi:hypothetical protein